MNGEAHYCVLCGWGPARCRCHEPTIEELGEQNANWHENHTNGSQS